MKNVLVVMGQHGNEPLGALLKNYMDRHNLTNGSITFIEGNPRAIRKNVRFTESDMNRSYNQRDTYEGRRAQALLSSIRKQQPDLVLDMHTTTSQQQACIIGYCIDEEVAEFIAASSIDKIVVMPSDIARGSLIGACKNAVSIEINVQSLDTRILSRLVADIQRYTAGNKLAMKRSYYNVYNKIYKSEVNRGEMSEVENFQLLRNGDVPVLMGENSYKEQTDYLGYRAKMATGIIHGASL